MRKLIFFALFPFMMVSTQSLAQENVQDDTISAQNLSTEENLDQLSDKLEAPELQDKVASTVEKMTAVMLQFPVGQFAEAVEDIRPNSTEQPIASDATIADLAGEQAINLPAKLGDESRKAMTIMGSLTGVFAQLIPEFKNIAEELEETIAQPISE